MNKSYKQCCDEVAKKHGLGETLVTGHRASYFLEAAELHERELLLELQRDNQRFFSREEFDRLRELSNKMFANAGSSDIESNDLKGNYLPQKDKDQLERFVMPSIQYFKSRRLELDLSLRDVASATGVSTATISRIERGKDADYSNIKALHDYYSQNTLNKHFSESQMHHYLLSQALRYLSNDTLKLLANDIISRLPKPIEDVGVADATFEAKACSAPLGETGDYDSWIELVTPNFTLQCFDGNVELYEVQELADILNKKPTHRKQPPVLEWVEGYGRSGNYEVQILTPDQLESKYEADIIHGSDYICSITSDNLQNARLAAENAVLRHYVAREVEMILKVSGKSNFAASVKNANPARLDELLRKADLIPDDPQDEVEPTDSESQAALPKSNCIDPLFEIKGCDMPKGSCADCGKHPIEDGKVADDYELNQCDNCLQLTNHLKGVCQKCKPTTRKQ